MRSANAYAPPMPSPSEPPTNERPQAEPVSDRPEQRRLFADSGGRGRLPDPFQEPRRQRLSGARKQTDHDGRRRIVLQLPAPAPMPPSSRPPPRQIHHLDSLPRT